jgi:alkaline phosphatase D
MDHSSSKKRMLNRRQLVGGGLAGAAVAQVPFLSSTARAHGGRLFTLGVASGDPGPTSVVLWTRLAPRPLEGGGMPNHPVAVRWEVALDPQLRRVIRRGVAFARPELAHTVHVTVDGLAPDRWYYYRFCAGHEDSPVGRTRTFPALEAQPQRMRFALVSCQDYQNGFYTAYANLAAEDLDFVVHVGDYIYEDATRTLAPRPVPTGETFSLSDYRNRYALYKLDPALQAAHAAFPFICTTDDHEVEDNYAGLIPEVTPDQDPAIFPQRRIDAYQAYFEHLPLRASATPRGNAINLFRRVPFGRLAQFHVLDTRQFRTDQPCGDNIQPACPGVFDPAATMTGSEQEQWLFAGLDRSPAIWNPIAQQVMFMKWDIGPAIQPGVPFFNMDAWDGYAVARQRILSFLAQRNPSNPIVLSGDIHSSWAAEILEDFAQPDSGVVAAEFVGTSISSDFPAGLIPAVLATLPANPHIKYFEGVHRGYLRFDVRPETWRADYRGVDTILAPQSPVSTLRSFVVEAGHAGLVSA